jgi:hypothetical protein
MSTVCVCVCLLLCVYYCRTYRHENPPPPPPRKSSSSSSDYYYYIMTNLKTLTAHVKNKDYQQQGYFYYIGPNYFWPESFTGTNQVISSTFWPLVRIDRLSCKAQTKFQVFSPEFDLHREREMERERENVCGCVAGTSCLGLVVYPRRMAACGQGVGSPTVPP